MIVEEILSKFEEEGQRGYYSFETFILNLLKYHIENQGKRFMPLENNRGIGNAIAEEGFDNFKGKIVVEIKFNLHKIHPRILLDQLVYRVSKNEMATEFQNLLIINYRHVPERVATKIIEELKDLNENINVTIWGPAEITKLINKHKKQATDIANNLFSLRLESTVTGENRDWEKEREERIQVLSESYEGGQFSLFLGAGVSSSAGMPDWNTLLNSLFVSYLTKEFNNNTNILDSDIKQIVSRLNEIDEPSALMAARYLRKGLSREASEFIEFAKTITDNLYQLRDTKKAIESELIVSISNLCMPRRTGARIKSVITYNFDDLLERQLVIKNIRHHSIYADNDAYDPEELPVYHVHGFLPENINKYDGLDKSTLVFSEEGYHQIYTDAYHWSNLVQLSNLRENTCVMIGLSMTDPNLRRLLDISARKIERPKHYAFMRRMTIENFAYSKPDKEKKTEQLIHNIKAAEQFLNRHHKLNEAIMKELGVSIIWFNKFEEIPEILLKINDQ